jgi:hypothetical protein
LRREDRRVQREQMSAIGDLVNDVSDFSYLV